MEPDLDKIHKMQSELKDLKANQHCKMCMGRGIKIWSPVPGGEWKYAYCKCLRSIGVKT
jgi:hypothetical protein